jgi:hypothetical protein
LAEQDIQASALDSDPVRELSILLLQNQTAVVGIARFNFKMCNASLEFGPLYPPGLRGFPLSPFVRSPFGFPLGRRHGSFSFSKADCDFFNLQ